MITIKLSKKELDIKNIGYQLPLPADQVKVSTKLEYKGDGSAASQRRGRGGRGRRMSRATSGNGFASTEHEDGSYGWNRGYPRGRGRGRGRNFRGRGRGGYNGPLVEIQRDSEAIIRNHQFEVVASRLMANPCYSWSYLVQTWSNEDIIFCELR
ncbi:unnamed protein product [Fraxinus pennsylvanica]|uniref:Uncharacterized protein n=1 Tax=Fraxinus pennsylvanica TaxID=56036 RepID=A0AAD1ZDV8_9LAMI|nr:unnamed protein product [Fraxinus pennsylvanica]